MDSPKTIGVIVPNTRMEKPSNPRDPGPSTVQLETRSKKSTRSTLASPMTPSSGPIQRRSCNRSPANPKKRVGAEPEEPDHVKRQRTSTCTTQGDLVVDDIYRVIILDRSSPIHGPLTFHRLTQAYRDVSSQGKYLNGRELGSKAEGKAKAEESPFRTGTKAFQSMYLLDGRPSEVLRHLERHDWESAFYALVWITTRYEVGKEVPKSETATNRLALEKWKSPDDDTNFSAKLAYMTLYSTRPKVRPMFEGLYKRWIDPLSILFDQGRIELVNACRRGDSVPSSGDDETLYGNVTYEKLWAILREDLPEASVLRAS